MTPLSNTEANQLMSDVATLKAQMGELNRWRVDVEDHDRKQDSALFAVEKRQDSFEFRIEQWECDRKASEKKSSARQKAILALCGCSAIDAVGWNLWNYVKPFLEPYMSRNFFWFSISIVGFGLLIYASGVLFKPKKESSRDEED
jgi:hypothetical protein